METLAPGERSGRHREKARERKRWDERKDEARRIEEQEEEGLPTAPTLGKFGVTRGDEDKRSFPSREEEIESKRGKGDTWLDEEGIC